MRRAYLLLRKDLLVLRRSPLLLGALLAYPIVIALLVGLVAGYASAKPRVAFVDEDGIPPVVVVGGHRFHFQTVIDDVAKQVTLVKLGAAEAKRELASGKVVATITVPQGFLGDLQTTVVSPHLILETGSGGLAPRVTQQVQALVYQLDRKLQEGYIAANLRFANLILHGGEGNLLGRKFTLLGLDRTQAELAKLPPSKRVQVIEDFVRQARAGIGQIGGALRSTANPITLVEASSHGRTWVLSAQVQAYGIALTVTFLALLLAAGAAASERDEGTIARLRRGLVSLTELVLSKIALAAVAALALGAAIAVVFGIVVEVGGITGGEPWGRLPLLLAGVVLAGAAVGALGTLLGGLADDARTATLLAVLLVLPVVFLGLVPRAALPLAYWVSLFLPFAHAARLFGAALYDTHPWHALGVEAAWLLGLVAAFGLLARRTLSDR